MTQNQAITEAYKKILSNKRNNTHRQTNKRSRSEKINESLVDEFISKVISVLSTIDESDNDKKNFITQQELENLKNQLQTPEDMEKYLVEHKNDIERCISRCEREGQSKIAKFMKYTLKFLWTAIKYGVPFIWKNKGMILVLILYFAVCNKLELSPWTGAKQLFNITWETGETVVDAATTIARTAKSYNDGAKSAGESVGNAISSICNAMTGAFDSLTTTKKEYDPTTGRYK